MAGHLKGNAHTLCWMLRLDLRDGTVIGLTEHELDLNFDLGDGAGTVRYRANPGLILSDIVQAAGFDADNFEFSVPLQAVGQGSFTLQAVEGGRFAGADVRLFRINWRAPSQGPVRWMLGNVTEGRPDGGVATFEVRSEKDKLNQTVGEVITPQCRTWHGSPLCGRTPENVIGTVTSVTDDMQFAVSYSGSFANDYFNFGKATFLTGALAGTMPMDIHKWTAAGAVVMYEALADDPKVGDTLKLERGCPRNRPACIARNNILNFRGEPDLPGTDKIIRQTIPGQGSDG